MAASILSGLMQTLLDHFIDQILKRNYTISKGIDYFWSNEEKGGNDT